MVAAFDRPYSHQEADLARLREALLLPKTRVLYVAFMGSGKTAVVAQLLDEVVRAGKRVLFIVHRRVLMQQTDARLHTHKVAQRSRQEDAARHSVASPS
jgi:superfamily II DNA or RNA helicase